MLFDYPVEIISPGSLYLRNTDNDTPVHMLLKFAWISNVSHLEFVKHNTLKL